MGKKTSSMGKNVLNEFRVFLIWIPYTQDLQKIMKPISMAARHESLFGCPISKVRDITIPEVGFVIVSSLCTLVAPESRIMALGGP